MIKNPFLSVFSCYVFLISIVLISTTRKITPNIDQKVYLHPFYITPNETQQYHLNHFFSGYNLKYSLLANGSSSCSPSIEIIESLQLLTNWTSTLNSENFKWSFYKEQSNLKRKIVGLDKDNNSLYTAELNFEDSVIKFNLSAILSSFNGSCQSYLQFKNYSNIFVHCVTPNMTEFLIKSDLSNSSQPLFAFYFDNNKTSQNFSHVKYLFNEEETYYFIRYWLSDENLNNYTDIEVYKYDALAQQFDFIERIDNTKLNMIETLTIIHLTVFNGEVFLSSLDRSVLRFRYFSNGTINLFINRPSYVLINKIEVFEDLNLVSNDLYVLLASEVSQYILIFNWTDPTNPLLLEKYGFMDIEGKLLYISFNENYVMYYAARKNSSNYFVLYERGKKLLNQVFLIMNYTREITTLFEFIPETNNLLIFSNFTIENYLLYDPLMRISANKINKNSTNSTNISNNCSISLIINSSDPGYPNTTTKSALLNIIMLNENDTNLYAISEDSPHSYIDYPGQSQFSLDNFYIGPNIFYSVKGFENNCSYFQSDNDTDILFNPTFLPNTPQPDQKLKDCSDHLYRINKINQLNFSFSFLNIDPSAIIYQKMQSNPLDSKYIIWVLQISNYTLYILNCAADDIEKPPTCSVQGSISDLNSSIVNMSLASKPNTLWFAMKIEDHPYDIFFYNYIGFAKLNITLPLPRNILSEIYDFTILDFKIVVVISLSKIIVIIDLNNPNKILFTIDQNLMNEHDVTYFSPIRVQCHSLHKNILFILNMIGVIIIDISNIYENEIIFIGVIVSEATRKFGNSFYFISISKNTLVISSFSPEIIEEYSLSNYYLIYKRKEYPLYNYTIVLSPESFDFNDASGLFFIHAIDENSNAVIMVFNSETIAHNVLYAIIPLNTKYPEIYVKSTNIDSIIYLAIINNTQILLYQIYRNSTLILNSLQLTFSRFNNSEFLIFNISITNSFQPARYNITYDIMTWDSGVNITLNEVDNDLKNSLIHLHKDMNNSVDFCPDSLFNGSIINFSIECDSDCGKNSDSIHLKPPLSFSKVLLLSDSYNDIFIQNNVIFLHTETTVFSYDKNFNLLNSMVFPDPTFICKKMAIYQKLNLTISACKNANPTYCLFLRDSLNNIVGMEAMPVNSIREMKIFKDHLIVLNAPEDGVDPYLFDSSIFIYSITPIKLILIDLIDSDDVELDHLYVSGMDCVETDYDELIRLFLIDPYSGLRIVDFNTSDIDQHHQYSLNLLDYIEKDGVDQAILFSSVKVVDIQTKSQPMTYSLIISTENFHTYEINLQVRNQEKNQNPLYMSIVRCYFRYGFYSAINKIIASPNNSWFFIIPYTLSNDLMINYTKYSKQIFIIYDRMNVFNQSIGNLISSDLIDSLVNQVYDYRHLFGGFVLDSLSQDYFATIIEKPILNDTMYTMIYKNPLKSTLDEILIRPNISIIFDHSWSNDSFLYLIAKNDYTKINVTLKINIDEQDEDDGTTKVWIVGLVIALLVVAIILIFVVKKYGKKNEEPEEDLLENEEEN